QYTHNVLPPGGRWDEPDPEGFTVRARQDELPRRAKEKRQGTPARRQRGHEAPRRIWVTLEGDGQRRRERVLIHQPGRRPFCLGGFVRPTARPRRGLAPAAFWRPHGSPRGAPSPARRVLTRSWAEMPARPMLARQLPQLPIWCGQNQPLPL